MIGSHATSGPANKPMQADAASLPPLIGGSVRWNSGVAPEDEVKAMVLLVLVVLASLAAPARSERTDALPRENRAKQEYVPLGSWLNAYGPFPEAIHSLEIFSSLESTLVRFSGKSLVDHPSKSPFRVLDELRLPRVADSLRFSVSHCRFEGKFDPEIFALVPLSMCYSHRAGPFAASRAWRADRRTNRIEELSTRGIRCDCQTGVP